MKVVIYLSGTGPTGAPWSGVAPVDNESACRCAKAAVARLSNGAPIAEVFVVVPEYFLVAPPPPVAVELEAGPVVEVKP